ncbi:PqqD family protein [Spirulina major]|uniref:PqqD family protein n=1 Tax=Spirulina major TaxID=270636 RepID=UPI0009334367|nr:PqqD family protein [Spirulina major]
MSGKFNSISPTELPSFYAQTKPNHIPGLEVHSIANELLIYSLELEVSVTLNASAQVIWNLCNGQSSITEIIASLAQSHGLNPEEIASDVITTVTRLQQVGLLELSTQAQ